MACKCKWYRWMPHNWFCLRGLYWIFVTLFYLMIAYTLYLVYVISSTPMLSGAAYWSYLISMLITMFGIMLGFLTVAIILKALRKIVSVVAPCCEENPSEEIVVVSSQDQQEKQDK